jgi:hypothetical protein
MGQILGERKLFDVFKSQADVHQTFVRFGGRFTFVVGACVAEQ